MSLVPAKWFPALDLAVDDSLVESQPRAGVGFMTEAGQREYFEGGPSYPQIHLAVDGMPD